MVAVANVCVKERWVALTGPVSVFLTAQDVPVTMAVVGVANVEKTKFAAIANVFRTLIA